MTHDAQQMVMVPRWALQFILDNAAFDDEGPYEEGWRSDEMIQAVEVLEKALDDSATHSAT